MSKNLTRKGLAFGALIALGTSVIAGAPALAAGIDNGSVSLAPNTGTEYNVLAGQKFELKSNFATGILGTGKYLKFYVSDPNSKTAVVETAGTSVYTAATVEGTTATTKASSTLTLTIPAHKFKTGDSVLLSGASNQTGLPGTTTAVTVTRTGDNTFTVPAGNATALSTPGNITVTLQGQSARSTTAGTVGDYTYDSRQDTNNASKVLRLSSTAADSTQTVTVTAWVDDNDNNKIDTTEYQSPARTINFLKTDDVVATTTFRPAAVGDTNVIADVTTSPVLNGDIASASYNLNGAANVIKATVGRPGDSTTPDSVSTSWSDTTKKWTVTSLDFNNAGWNQTAATKVSLGAAGTATATVWKYKIVKQVVTITTGTRSTISGVTAWRDAAHGLRVGDKITVTDGTVSSRWEKAAAVVTSVPTTSTFTFVETATTGDDIAEVALADATTVSDFGLTTPVYLRDKVEAGDVSAQAYIYNAQLAAGADFVKAGAKTSYAVGSKVASTVTIAGVASATVSSDAQVLTGTKTAAIVAKVKNADGDYVGAGIDAAITATTVTSNGTVKINGTTVTSGTVVYAKTNASGKVEINIENSSAANTDSVVLDVVAQGVTATQTTVDWNDAVYSILDLNDQTLAGAARNRAVAKGASYTFDFLVQDQFKAVAPATIRLKVASAARTIFTNTFALTSGKASVVVADGGLSTGTADVTVTLQKQATDGTWADLADGSGNTWDGAGSGDLAIVNINYYDQTDAITLNADSANYPSSTTADYTAAVSTVALTAADTRNTYTSAPAVLTAAKAVVAGKVAHATTSVGKAGVLVTLTGAGLLFKSGDVWTVGSATVLSNDGTFAVEVYSAASGEKKVAISAGAATATATITFTGVSTDAKKLTVTPSSATYVAGQTVVYNILLTDTNGNPVNTVAPAATPASAYITVSYEGPGIISGSLPVETDADGKATVRIVTGTADLQNAVLTVKYDQNYDGDVLDTNDLTVVSTVPVLVVEPSAVVNVVGHRVYVKFNDAKGEEVSAVIGGVRITKTATYSGYVISKLVKAGKVAVKAYVAGDLVKAATVTVK